MALKPIIDDDGNDRIAKLCLRRANGGRLGRLEALFMDFDVLDALDDVELVGVTRGSDGREWAFGQVHVPFERLPEREWFGVGLW